MLEFINWMEIISLWTRPTPQREPITTTTTTMFIGMTAARRKILQTHRTHGKTVNANGSTGKWTLDLGSVVTIPKNAFFLNLVVRKLAKIFFWRKNNFA
jgi:hypothetical protein